MSYVYYISAAERLHEMARWTALPSLAVSHRLTNVANLGMVDFTELRTLGIRHLVQSEKCPLVHFAYRLRTKT